MGAPFKASALPRRRDQVLAFVVDRIVRTGVCPTTGEIGLALDFSRQRAQQLVDQLIREGVIENTPASPRSLRVRDLAQCRHIILATLSDLGFALVETIGQPAPPLSPAQLPMMPPFEYLPDPE